MNIRIGPPVTGANFYKRPSLIATLMRALERGNVAFLGPRRTGKTSCLEEIRSNPGEYMPILLNLEQHDTVEAWLVDMVAELRKELEKPRPLLPAAGEKIAAFLERINKIEVGSLGGLEIRERSRLAEWRKPADEFLEILSDTNAPVIFLLDEFPTFLKLVSKRTSRDEVEALLNWFRAARHTLKDKRARFLVTGSIGLKGVVRKLGLAPSVNEFDTVEIPPLSDPEALGLLEALASHHALPLPEECRKHILTLLGGNWPILIQLFISELQEANLQAAPTLEQLHEIYMTRLVGGSRNQYCEGMFDRLAETFSPSECRLAREILKANSRTPEGLTREEFEAIHARIVPDDNLRLLAQEELDYVLDTLKHDGYLRQLAGMDQRTQFGSNILRDFWRRKTA